MLLLIYVFATHPQIKEVEERFKAREDSIYCSAVSFHLLKRMIEIRLAELRFGAWGFQAARLTPVARSLPTTLPLASKAAFLAFLSSQNAKARSRAS